MVNITNIPQQNGVPSPGTAGVRQAAVPPGPDRSPRDPEAGVTSPAKEETPQAVPEMRKVPDYLDPNRVEAYLSRVAEAIEKAADGPHVVGFRLDPDSGTYVVEVRDRNGDLVTTLKPQKILNRPANPDEPTGMLVDQLT